jgi:hypothetical protein
MTATVPTAPPVPNRAAPARPGGSGARSAAAAVAGDPVAATVLVALLIHAVAGEPTPDRPGAAVVATAGLLVLALGGAAITARLRPGPGPAPPPWSGAGAVAVFALLLVPPLAMTAGHGWTGVDIVRDLVALAALAAPIVMWAAAARADDPGPAARLADALSAGLVAIGVGHAVRFVLAVEAPPGTLGVAGGADGERYLANGPAVVFAAVRLSLAAGRRLVRPDPAALATAGALALAAVPPILVLAMTLQRAALAAIALAVLVAVLVWAGPRPGRLAGLALVAGVILVPLGGPMLDLLGALVDKTRLVGANARLDELAATATALSTDPLAALVGTGWGAVVVLPAIDPRPVSYLHVLPLYLAWKAGLVGLVAGTVWLAGLARPIAAAGRRRVPETLAVLAALAVATTVQPGFKTLAFALILALPVLRSHTIEGRR